MCDTSGNSTQFWNAPLWLNPDFGGTNLADAPADLSISARDTCGNALIISYLLFLDLDGNGQQETVVNSIQPPPTSAVYFGNAANPNYAGGQYRQFDQRPVPSFFRYRFGIETQTVGGVTTARLRWRTPASVLGGVLPQLPYGKHRIRWMVRNAAGQEAVCEYAVVVKDCGVPRVTCINTSLPINIQSGGRVTFSDINFLAQRDDNYWPQNELWVGVRKAGTGTGFPVDQQGTPIRSVGFKCTELGTNMVEVWLRDGAGNVSQCNAQVTIQDNLLNCKPDSGRITICAMRYCDGKPVTDFQVSIGAVMEVVTDSAGCKILEFSSLGLSFIDYIEVFKDDDPLSGLDQTDVDLIRKHILGTQPFTSPWAYLAADINRSGSINAFDPSELSKLLDGTYNQFPNNTSWRFIPEGFVFPDPNNPFPYNPFLGPPVKIKPFGKYFFRGIKIGDVNCSLNFTGQLEERQGNNTQIADGEIFASPYPNPTSGGTTFLLQLTEASEVELTLSDLTGREVFRLYVSGIVGENRAEIPASAFPRTGVYVWRVKAGGAARAGKVVRL